MGIAVFQVDSFTSRPFAGNPAAVCLLKRLVPANWMQSIAAEMNLSETAFVVPRGDEFDLRWMTPTVEVDLCGHATLACAHVLWEEGWLSRDQQARFHTRSGLLTARSVAELIEMDFPAVPTTPESAPEGLLIALGANAVNSARAKYDWLIEFSNEQEVRNLRPDFREVAKHCERGVIVTARATAAPYDFISRFFGPAAGIDEDPVTGSAHCALAPYWEDRLGKTEMLAYQASVRGGEVRVRTVGDRVILGGQAVTVFRGELAEGAA